MELSFLGAADTVTGSRTILKYHNRCFLIDCGLFQGSKKMRQRNREPLPTDPNLLSAVLITHAHIDHTGYLPCLVKQGYRGPIHCSEGTSDLLKIMLYDAAHLEEEFADYADTSAYSNHKPAIPLFTKKDVALVLKLLVPHDRNKWVDVSKGCSLRFLNAGHIIGASILQLRCRLGSVSNLITFSGDLGNDRLATMRPPETIEETDILILESTYGHRLQEREDLSIPLANIVNRIVENKGCLLIPSFAVGRAQEVLLRLRQLEDAGTIPKIPVVLDSPLSNAATDIFFKHPEDYKASIKGISKENFLPSLFEISESTDQSMMTGMRDGPLVVISAAGMLNGGRILHHLKRRLPHPENSILFVGYQAEGTKGRFLQDHHKTGHVLRIHHKEVEIEAKVETLGGLSSHADYKDILEWLAKMTKLPRLLFLNHGSEDSKAFLATKINERFQINPVIVTRGLTKRL